MPPLNSIEEPIWKPPRKKYFCAMKKIVTVIGARPQFIKAAAVNREIQSRQGIEEILVHTGQHYDANMSDVFFDELNIPRPQYNLDIHGVGHGAMTGRMLEGIEQILFDEKPDVLMVYGDTNSTIAGALAAKKLHIPVAHVEAGLRSHNMRMPEEVNRILTDRISDYLFCPTDDALLNLRREGFDNLDAQVHKVGDVMQDAALFYASRAKRPGGVPEKEFVLCTIHRAENTDVSNRLALIFDELRSCSASMPVVLPLHPRTKAALKREDISTEGITLIDPVGYLEMVWLLQHAGVVCTDSGGLQKEAFFFGKPCVTVRDETEWVELVENGLNRLAPPIQRGVILDSIRLAHETAASINFNQNLYGNGEASKRIVDMLSAI